MYFNELKRALYFDETYSIENLKNAYIFEEYTDKVKKESKYSLVEIFEQLEKSRLHDSGLMKLPSIIGLLTRLSDSSSSPSAENNYEILEEIEKFVPKESFTQVYKIRYIKTVFRYFLDAYRKTAICTEESLTNWKKSLVQPNAVDRIARVALYVFEIISSDRRQIFSRIDSCKKRIKQNLREDIQKSSFTSDDLVRFCFYGQVISFFLAVNSKQARNQNSYEEEAISYMAYFLADGFIASKQLPTFDTILLAKKGLKITDFSDQQRAFNALGSTAIDCNQNQLAYDTFFSWINRRAVGELKNLVPTTFFQSDDDVVWREAEGKKAVAFMKGNFSYVCGMISDTYEPNSERWKVFHGSALTEIFDSIKLDPKNSSFHCTCGTLLAENKEYLDAFKHYELYHKYNREPADNLDSLRLCCKTLLNIVVIPLVQPDRGPNGKSEAIQKRGAEGTAAESETVLVQIGLQAFLWQAMIGSQNEDFGVTDYNV